MATVVDIKPKSAPSRGPRDKYAHWLSRAEASDLIGCAPGTLKTYEARGWLKPVTTIRQDVRGTPRELVVYDPAELGRLPRRAPRPADQPGEAAARAFELFDLGRPVREVVIEVRQMPEVVIGWHQQWLKYGGAAIVVAGVVKDQLAAAVGDFVDAVHLVKRVQALAAELAAAKARSSSK